MEDKLSSHLCILKYIKEWLQYWIDQNTASSNNLYTPAKQELLYLKYYIRQTNTVLL